MYPIFKDNGYNRKQERKKSATGTPRWCPTAQNYTCIVGEHIILYESDKIIRRRFKAQNKILARK